MDAASWSAALPLIITFALGIFGLWFAIRTEVARVRAEVRDELREVRAELKADIQRLEQKFDQKFDAMGVRVSEYELEQARQEGMLAVLGNQAHAHESGSAPRSG